MSGEVFSMVHHRRLLLAILRRPALSRPARNSTCVHVVVLQSREQQQRSSAAAAAIAAPCTVTAKPECTKRKHDRSIVSVALCFNKTKWLTLPSNERSFVCISEPWRTGAWLAVCVRRCASACECVRVRVWRASVRACVCASVTGVWVC